MSNHRVCPVEHAGGLDNKLRRWLQNPRKILGPYVKAGMTVLDLGCGPGFFTIDLADMVGASGRVIAADLQEGMLEKLRAKIRGSAVAQRVTTRLCPDGGIGVTDKIDLALAFYLAHEVPDQDGLFREIVSLLKSGG